MSSELPATLQGLAEGDLIGKFDVAAHGKTIGDPGNFDTKGGELFADVLRGDLALCIGVVWILLNTDLLPETRSISGLVKTPRFWRKKLRNK